MAKPLFLLTFFLLVFSTCENKSPMPLAPLPNPPNNIDLWATNRSILRDHLANSRITFTSTKKGRIVFLGGSITFNTGWRTNVMDFIQRKFPETSFDFINAAIPSVGSIMHAFRLEKDVFNKGPVDLLFIESAVNDMQNMTPSIIRTRATEGIIRHALARNPNVDIVMQYFADSAFYPEITAGKPVQCLADYDKIAAYYGISSVKYEQYVAETMTWEQFGGNVHPGTVGTKIYTDALGNLIFSAWKDTSQQTTIPHNMPNTAIDSFCYSLGKFDTLTKAAPAAGWQYINNWVPSDGMATIPGFKNVPIFQALAPNAVCNFHFTGTAIGIVVTSGPDAGILDYCIDDSICGTKDQYTVWSKSLHLPWTLLFCDTLSNTPHTLTITTSNQKNSLSTGYACRIHQFAVNGK